MSGQSHQFEASPLGRFGAEIRGVTATSLTHKSPARFLREMLYEHQLLLFRGLQLSSEEQLRFTRLFGELDDGISRRPETHHVGGQSDVLKVDNSPGSPTAHYGFGWHSDGLAYALRPHGVTVLQCIACPPGSGDTEFCTQYDAYDRLTATDRLHLEGLLWYLPPLAHSEAEDGFGLAQPFVRQHPVTTRNFLYFAPQASRVRGLGPEESEALTSMVRRIQVAKESVYVHHWRPGDLVVWENCALLHRRAAPVDFAEQGLREMHRTATVGSVEAIPCEAPPPHQVHAEPVSESR